MILSARQRSIATQSLLESIEVEAAKAAVAMPVRSLTRWQAIGMIPDAARNAWDRALGLAAAAAVMGERLDVGEIFAQHMGNAWPLLKTTIARGSR